MEQEQQPRKQTFIRELVPDRRPTRGQELQAGRIIVVRVFVLVVLTLIGLPYSITLWDWVKVLIVPAVIAGGGIWFNRQQQQREQRIAEQRAQHEALQAYLDRIGNLLLDKARPLRESQDGDEVNTLARARTLTILRRLDPARKRSVLDFLYEADLIKKSPRRVIDLGSRDFEYSAANLSRADLRGADLRRADLSGMKIGANLSGADLRGADLRDANLSHATLRGADMRGAHLIGTQFTEANLWGAQLSGAYFQSPVDSTQQYAAELRAAGLPDDHSEQAARQPLTVRMPLQFANLEWAVLSGVRGMTNMDVEVQTPLLLEGATMPDGQKYEDWIKSRGEDGGENSGSS